ncbi:MAG: hypothetical protein ACJ8FV_09660, partial [Xanthobacteraceae bacterium]
MTKAALGQAKRVTAHFAVFSSALPHFTRSFLSGTSRLMTTAGFLTPPPRDRAGRRCRTCGFAQRTYTVTC